MKMKEILEASSRATAAKSPGIPSMEHPGCKVTALQSLRDSLPKAIEKLGYYVMQQGFTDASTKWAVAFEIDKNFNIEAFENLLRAELHLDGWLSVEFFDLVED